MSTTAAALRGTHLPHEMREALVAANASSITATGVAQSLLSLEQKRGVGLIVAGGSTRTQINSLNLSIEEKKALLDIAGV